MAPTVKPSTSSRALATEGRIVAAATELFVQRGYRSTTMGDIARLAGVSDRTVYVRFATKSDVLKRAMDVAIVGDLDKVELARRDWAVAAMTAPTLEERLRADASGTATLFARLAPLVAVAIQVEADEPAIAASAAAGRRNTLAHQRELWENLRRDGLMNAESDLEWVITTAGLVGSPEAFLSMTRTTAVTIDEYANWRFRTWWLLATTPGSTR